MTTNTIRAPRACARAEPYYVRVVELLLYAHLYFETCLVLGPTRGAKSSSRTQGDHDETADENKGLDT